MKVTSVFKRNIAAYRSGARYVVNKGSTRSGKTWSVLQLLYMIASYSEQPLTISVVSETLPHLKRGCIRDFIHMLIDEGLFIESDWNKTDKIYRVHKSQIEFFSADVVGKVHGPARDILFINECQNIAWEVQRQLSIRTRRTVFLDYNPVSTFWVDKNILGRADAVLIHSTYADNEYLTTEQVREIESNRHDENWWRVYGLGETGGREGLVYSYNLIDEMPASFSREGVGLDFGFTNDPTAVLHCGLVNGELYVDEIEYSTGLLNSDIAERITAAGKRHLQIVADSAEQKSIAELRRAGLQVRAAVKGKGSVVGGIGIVNQYRINVTRRSLNVIDEMDNYRYEKDKLTDKLQNAPCDAYNHAMDALRYWVVDTVGSNINAGFKKIRV